MTKFKYFLINFFIFIFFTFEGYSEENKILFKLNNEIVTTIDLLNEINYLKSINSEYVNTSNDIAYKKDYEFLTQKKWGMLAQHSILMRRFDDGSGRDS